MAYKVKQNLQRIKAAADDIREVIDLCYEEVGDDERIEDYAPKLARLSVDDASEQIIATAARTTAGGVAVKDTIAVVDKVYGNTLVWNNIAESIPTKTNNGVTLTRISDTKVHISGTCTTTFSGDTWFSTKENPIIKSGHKVFARFDLGYGKTTNSYAYLAYHGGQCIKTNSNIGCIYTTSRDISGSYGVSIWINEGDSFDLDVCCILCDLTTMFGSGQEPTSVDDFCLKIFGKESADVTDAEWEAISAYCEPTLLSSKPKKIVSKPADASYTSEITIDPTAIVDEDGEQVFPNGLLSAGTAKDYIDIERGVAVKCVESVDLGSLSWSNTSLENRYFCTLPSDAELYMQGDYRYAIAKYTKSASIPTTDKCISLNNNKYAYILDSSYSTKEDFKTAMNGVVLYYKLATPIEYPLPKRKPFYRVSNGGSEKITADGMTTPMVADIAYREAVTASEAVAMLAEASGIN